MELYQEIIMNLLSTQEMQISFPGLQLDINKLVESECYKALQGIHQVLQDDTLNDTQCFEKIEEIVCIFETLGSSGGNRHDFG